MFSKDTIDEIMESSREIFTVSELNHAAKEILEETFPSIWVEGEISNLACPGSGHMYFTLKDDKAQVRCALFRNRTVAKNCKLSNGLQVLVKAHVSLYEGRGDYQLIIEYLEEAGFGQLQRAFGALKQKLDQEGLFGAQHKKTIPIFPSCVGIITSPTGAAIRDVLSVLNRRFPALPVIIYPSQVQGQTAAAQIVQAIKTANERSECDVLLLTRGGGSLEDLWPFNEEIVARAIHASEIPIVSAIGHEIDFTIADFVADLRAPTPSVAAELISPNQIEWLNRYIQHEKRLFALLQHLFTIKHQQLEHLHKRLRHPKDRLQEFMQRVDHLEQLLMHAMQQILIRAKHRLQICIRTLNTISPLATLERGYSIVTNLNTGKIIDSFKDINIGEQIKARLHEGDLVCTVDQVDA